MQLLHIMAVLVQQWKSVAKGLTWEFARVQFEFLKVAAAMGQSRGEPKKTGV